MRGSGKTDAEIKRSAVYQGFQIRDGHGIVFVSNQGDICPSGFLPLSCGNVRTSSLVDVYRQAPLFQSLHSPEQFEESVASVSSARFVADPVPGPSCIRAMPWKVIHSVPIKWAVDGRSWHEITAKRWRSGCWIRRSLRRSATLPRTPGLGRRNRIVAWGQDNCVSLGKDSHGCRQI